MATKTHLGRRVPFTAAHVFEQQYATFFPSDSRTRSSMCCSPPCCPIAHRSPLDDKPVRNMPEAAQRVLAKYGARSPPPAPRNRVQG